MNGKEFREHVAFFQGKMRGIIDVKNNDYSVDDDAMSNYKEIGKWLDLSPIKVWGVLFFKHVTAIATFVRDGKVESEGIHGRFLDAANYCVLGDALVSEAQDFAAVDDSSVAGTSQKTREEVEEKMRELTGRSVVAEFKVINGSLPNFLLEVVSHGRGQQVEVDRVSGWKPWDVLTTLQWVGLEPLVLAGDDGEGPPKSKKKLIKRVAREFGQTVADSLKEWLSDNVGGLKSVADDLRELIHDEAGVDALVDEVDPLTPGELVCILDRFEGPDPEAEPEHTVETAVDSYGKSRLLGVWVYLRKFIVDNGVDIDLKWTKFLEMLREQPAKWVGEKKSPVVDREAFLRPEQGVVQDSSSILSWDGTRFRRSLEDSIRDELIGANLWPIPAHLHIVADVMRELANLGRTELADALATLRLPLEAPAAVLEDRIEKPIVVSPDFHALTPALQSAHLLSLLRRTGALASPRRDGASINQVVTWLDVSGHSDVAKALTAWLGRRDVFTSSFIPAVVRKLREESDEVREEEADDAVVAASERP